MKKILFFILTTISLSAFAQDKATNSDLQTRAIDEHFNAISVSDGIELVLTQGHKEKIEVGASDEKYLDELKTEVENGVLKIYYGGSGIKWNVINEKRKLKAYVSFTNLTKLTAASGAKVKAASNLDLEDLEMKFSSGSNFEGKLAAENLTVHLTSAAGIEIEGKAQKLKVDASGGAVFKGFDFATEYCDAKATSAASIRITVNKELNASASSGGGVKYKGDGLIRDISASSGGVVKKA